MTKLSLKNIELLNSIYNSKSIKNLDSRSHNRNIKALRDSNFLLKDNTLSNQGLQAIGKLKIASKPVKAVSTVIDNNVNLISLFQEFLKANNITVNNTATTFKNATVTEVKSKPVANNTIINTIELVDRKKRSIAINKEVFTSFTKLLAGKHFNSYETASNVSLKFAIANKLVKIVKKDGKETIKNVSNESKLPYTHFLNSYIYKNGYIL